jgi:hypothetical protein
MGLRSSLSVWRDRLRTRGTFAHALVAAVVGLAVITALIALDELLFLVVLDTHYPKWFLANGTVIGIAFALFTVAWGDVNKLTSLISAHPLEYGAGCIALFTLPSTGLSSALRFSPVDAQRRRKLRYGLAEARRVAQSSPLPALKALAEQQEAEEAAARAASSEEEPPRNLGFADVWLALAFSAGFLLVYFGWLLVVAPLQYVVNLLAGAPARLALASPERAWVRFTPRETAIEYGDRSADPGEDAFESGFSATPVTYTAAVAGALLFGASKLVG